MQSVLTLIAPPGGLDDSTAAAAAAALAREGAAVGPPAWLAPGEACDLPFEGPLLAAADAAAHGALAGRAVDVIAQRARGRRKRLLVADMDSTIIESESLDELAAIAGVKDAVAALTRQAMNGEIAYDDSLRRRVAMIAGLPVSALDDVLARLRPSAGAAVLVATMRAGGARTVLVTSGFRFFSTRVARALGFDEDVANDLEIADGRLTGRVREPILNRDGKRRALERAAAALDIPLDAALAVGDGANDLDMIRLAGLGVAFRAKPAVAAAARARVNHGDLTALLYAQGYRQAEFARKIKIASGRIDPTRS